MFKRIAFLMLALFIVPTVIFAEIMPAPVSQQYWIYPPTPLPIPSADPSLARPLGVGSVAIGGDTLSLHISGQFSTPVDIYFGVHVPAVDPDNIYILKSDYTLQILSMGIVPWKNAISNVDEHLFGDIPIIGLPSGTYHLFLAVTPTGSIDRHYLWETSFAIPCRWDDSKWDSCTWGP